MAKHKTWQSTSCSERGEPAQPTQHGEHTPARSRAVPQHLINTERNREHNSSPQSKHHTADFTARAEHGHTEQSLAHATVHEHKHPVETSLEQNRIAEHTSQSRAQDSSTHRRAQLAHTPQSAISSQRGSKSRRQQEQQGAQRAAAHSIAMHAAEQTSHDRAHVQGGTRNNTQHGRHTPATSSAEHGSTNTE